MATIHISEIQKLLAERGRVGCDFPIRPVDDFLEIRFDDPASKTSVIDKRVKDAVITADCAFGFDDESSLTKPAN
ncbi:MAG: hypothetical protein IPJ30_06735 [Acidobacteria bacterium]|nr:hypothetical protein [Acidobacteriota bacterium]